MTVNEVFDDIAGIIAHLNPQEIIGLKAPKEMSERVNELINQKKNEKLSIEEGVELERLLALDLFISLTKAKAKALLEKA